MAKGSRSAYGWQQTAKKMKEQEQKGKQEVNNEESNPKDQTDWQKKFSKGFKEGFLGLEDGGVACRSKAYKKIIKNPKK